MTPLIGIVVFLLILAAAVYGLILLFNPFARFWLSPEDRLSLLERALADAEYELTTWRFGMLPSQIMDAEEYIESLKKKILDLKREVGS